MGRVVTEDELVAVRRTVRAEGKRFVFTNGCFDLLHRGHVTYLEAARAMGDVLAVGVNSDASVRRIKGEKRPLVPEEDRVYVVACLSVVDYACLFDEETPHRIITRLVPDVLVKGGDYRTEEIVGRDVVEAAGGRVVVVEQLEGRSTRQLVARILELYGGSAGAGKVPPGGG